jgi:hypothetical protein
LNKNRGNDLLHERTVRQIKAIVADGAVRSVRRQHSLRNHLFHYDFVGNAKKRMVPFLVPDLPLCGLVEAHTFGRSLADLAKEVEQGLDSVSEGLTSLLLQPLIPQGTL